MADPITLAGIEAELADTADYDVAIDVSKAKRRVAAFVVHFDELRLPSARQLHHPGRQAGRP